MLSVRVISSNACALRRSYRCLSLWTSNLGNSQTNEKKMNISKRYFSDEKKPLYWYTGEYSGVIKRLKRVSMLSSCVSCFGLPIAMIYSSMKMTVIGKIAIASTICFASVSSTCLLHICTLPYIINLQELPAILLTSESTSTSTSTDITPTTTAVANKKESIHLRATRLNIFGMEEAAEFSLDDVKKAGNSGVGHPFANFEAKNKWYYINVDKIDDPRIRQGF